MAVVYAAAFFSHMRYPNKHARKNMQDIALDTPILVDIPGTKKSVRLKGMKPYTIERMSKLWIERDLSREDTVKAIKDDPYFNHKLAALFVLNGFWQIKLFYGFLWRWYSYIREYSQEQLMPIIMEAKKKIPLYQYWMNMALTLDMRDDWMMMTKREAESYQAELISAEKRHS